ncbi:sporulation-delaying protein SdpB family protein [Brevibacterium otitidis]|uniref:Sporulation-delaying protein SdpB family protein n=1 Tax=Brevibacterium otitidis TaxID=53364 RepID=A0ABV5X252_9MICO
MLNSITSVLSYTDRAISATPAGSRKIALARTLIASGQLSVLLFTDWHALFVPTDGGSFGPSCNGVGRVGAYCMMYDSVGLVFPSVVMIVGLVIVLSGFFPRYTGILHAWVTLSISPATSLPDGGEAVSQIVVVILAVVLLSDGRLNHWHATTSSGSPLLPVTWAASHLLRFQLIWVYLNAAISKTSVPEWKDGTAVYFITLDPMFGTSGPFGLIFDWLVNIPVFSLLMTWGAIVIEVAIALLLLGSARWRPAAFWLAVLLHGMFIAMIGLWSFAFVMIGAVLAATGPTLKLYDIAFWNWFDERSSNSLSNMEEVRG